MSISYSQLLSRGEREGGKGTRLVAGGHLGAEELAVTYEGGA